MTCPPLPSDHDDDMPAGHRVTPVDAHCATPPPPLSPPHDGLLLPAVWELIAPHLQRAHTHVRPPEHRDTAAADLPAHARLPTVRSDEWLDAHPDVQLATLLLLSVAWLISDPHLTVRALLTHAGHDVHGGTGDQWARAATNHLPHDELQRRRRPPDAA